jgi:hypothetical protein
MVFAAGVMMLIGVSSRFKSFAAFEPSAFSPRVHKNSLQICLLKKKGRPVMTALQVSAGQ